MSHKVNILFYEVSSGSGGSANALAQVVERLDKGRFRPVVMTTALGQKIAQIEDAKVIAIRDHNETDDFSGLRAITSSIAYAWETLRAYVVIKTNKIALVHINTNIIAGIPLIVAAKVAGIPCVCHVRQTRDLLKREKMFAGWINRFIVLNRDMKEILKRYVPEEKIELIYDGIDLEMHGKMEDGRWKMEKEKKPCVGIVGRMVEGKGHEDFIRAAAIVARTRADARFLVVGSDPSGDKRTESRLKTLAGTMGLNGNMTFTGWRDDVSGIISGLALAAYPYTAPEGLPNVIIETMALGRPVISTHIPGPTEVVVDGKTGFLVPPGDIRALAEKMLYLLDHPEVARAMGEAGRVRVEEAFTIEKTVGQIEKVYEKVIGL